MALKLPQYPSFSDTKLPWIGSIPINWSIKPLFSCMQEKKYKNEKGQATNVLSLSYGRIVDRDVENNFGLLPKSFDTYQIVEPGDIILRLTDLQNDKKSLRTGLVRKKGIITSAYLCIAHNSDEIVPEYVHYLLHSYDISKVFYGMGGGLRQSMKYEDLRRLDLVIPSIEEQKSIVSFLDHETAKIDDLITKQERLIELLKEKVLSLALTPYQRGKAPKVRLGSVVELISRPVQQQPEELYVPLGLYNRGRGLFHKEPREKDDMGDSDFFWIKEGDLIISGQFAWEGAVALAGASENNTVASHRYPVLRGKQNKALTEYIYSLLLSKHGAFLLNENSRGAAGRNKPLNINSLLKEKIPVPSMDDQHNVSKALHVWRRACKKVRTKIKLLKERRTALISAAVTGKIDVRNWKPDTH